MCAHKVAEPHTSAWSIEAWVTWVGGGERRELNERHERSAHVVAGVVVLTNVALAWLVTTLTVMQAGRLPVLVVAPFALAFALSVGAVSRAIAAGPAPRAAGRGAAVVAVGLILGGVVGEFAALAVFSGSIDRQLQQQAARNADSAPAVVQASSNVQRMRDARIALDHAVDIARAHRDEALVVARCEYHPTPGCPQTRITGVPGSGPETRTANELLADSQYELDEAVTANHRRAAELEFKISGDERVLADERQSAIADVDHGLGARWVAMQQLTSTSASTLIMRLLTVGFFAALALLPLIVRLWRGETTHDRNAQARAERERAELVADTAIAVKRAEVRAAAETLWAEQQLAQARLAVEAQTEIDRAQLRHRVNTAIEGTTRDPAREAEDIYLPIAAEAEAASIAATELVAVASAATEPEAENLPAVAERQNTPAKQTIPTIPDVTRAAARWIRPLVPGFVARAIDTSAHPLRTARQVIEEVEEITFSLKHTRTLSIHAEESAGTAPTRRSAAQKLAPRRPSAERPRDHSLVSGRRESHRELTERDGPAELGVTDGPRQLPPAE